METWLAPTVLAVVGLAVLAFGVYVWRGAVSIVEDALRTLHGMFGEGFPGLFTGDADPRAARIPGAVMIGLGLVSVGAAVVLVIVR
ncbi:MAG: hypothetical protein J0J03_00425 [Leifsonia sp.]|nr:hypothetical protein [Leifsonia sp.]